MQCIESFWENDDIPIFMIGPMRCFGKHMLVSIPQQPTPMILTCRASRAQRGVDLAPSSKPDVTSGDRRSPTAQVWTPTVSRAGSFADSAVGTAKDGVAEPSRCAVACGGTIMLRWDHRLQVGGVFCTPQPLWIGVVTLFTLP